MSQEKLKLPKELRALLEGHQSYFNPLSSGKIVCTLNGHELPARVDVISTFIKGNKYTRLKAAADAQDKLKKYEPFLTQSKNFEDKLYCALTCQLLGKSVEAVRQHMKGKKFQRAKERYEEDEQELIDEPVDAKQLGDGASEGGTTAAGDEGLWVPEEFAEMEAEAAAEAAAERSGDGAEPADEASDSDADMEETGDSAAAAEAAAQAAAVEQSGAAAAKGAAEASKPPGSGRKKGKPHKPKAKRRKTE